MARYLASRLIGYVGVILFGITFIFFLPRFLPSDPVEAMLGKIMSQGQYMEESQVEALRSSLTDAFGLKGSLMEQYGRFIKRVLITGDFGPSLAMYPTPVNQLIRDSLPWTFGLLLSAVLIAWIFGNALGIIVSRLGGRRVLGPQPVAELGAPQRHVDDILEHNLVRVL